MISKTESGRVGYQKKYRVAGRVRVPAGHCLYEMDLIIDLNALLESMIARVEDGGPLKYQCQTCGKTMKDKTMIKRHAEVHLDLSHTCIVCQKQFKTRNSLSVHYSQKHKDQVMSPWATT